MNKNTVSYTVLENFYMDDCLKSVDSKEKAIRMSDELSQLLKKGGFNLTKWLSNNDRIISNFVLEKRAKVYLDLKEAKSILHPVLGVRLNVEEDSFQIDVNVKDKPLIRRGVLSQVSAVFDPLGFAAPIILKLVICWSNWILNLICPSELKVDRYFSDFEDADQIESAENVIIQSVQPDHFHKEIDHLQRNKVIGKNVLTKLNSVVFKGVLRVERRVDKANIPFAVKHPVVLPNHSHVTKLVIQDYHERVSHVGMSHTWATIRQKFWIVKGAATIRNALGQCLLCKRRNTWAGQQIMSDLPNSRLAANRVGYFGPWTRLINSFSAGRNRR